MTATLRDRLTSVFALQRSTPSPSVHNEAIHDGHVAVGVYISHTSC